MANIEVELQEKQQRWDELKELYEQKTEETDRTETIIVKELGDLKEKINDIALAWKRDTHNSK